MFPQVVVFDVFIWSLLHLHVAYLNKSGAQLGGEGGGKPPLSFFENQKKLPWFWRKIPWLCPSLIKFAIQNVVLKVSKRKNSKIFPCGAFFLDFLIICLSKCPNFTKPPLPWNCAPANYNWIIWFGYNYYCINPTGCSFSFLNGIIF